MGKMFSYDSPIVQAINKIVDCVILSVLWLICSVPIITFGASSTALYYTVNKVIRHNRSHVWREFFTSFKSNFKQSTIVWLILMVIYYMIGIDCIFMYDLVKTGAVGTWVLILFAVTLVFVTMWAMYAFGYIARFQNNLKAILKNCAFLVIRHLLRSILLVIIFVTSVLIFMFLPVVIVILPTMGMFLLTIVLESVFERYMIDEDLVAEADRNQVYYN